MARVADLRHRRISLLHLRGVPWARIGEHVGQRSLAVAADAYHPHPPRRNGNFDYHVLLAPARPVLPHVPTQTAKTAD
jgi:hypothetical protein